MVRVDGLKTLVDRLRFKLPRWAGAALLITLSIVVWGVSHFLAVVVFLIGLMAFLWLWLTREGRRAGRERID